MEQVLLWKNQEETDQDVADEVSKQTADFKYSMHKGVT